MTGWIKLYRQILGWEYYKDEVVFRLFLHLLLKANFEPGTFKGVKIQRGQLITSLQNLADQLGLSIKKIRRGLGHLKGMNEVTVTGTAYSLITVLKYDSYQGPPDEEGTERAQDEAQKGHEKGQQLKKKRRKEENNTAYRFESDEIWDAMVSEEMRRTDQSYEDVLSTVTDLMKQGYSVKQIWTGWDHFWRINVLPKPIETRFRYAKNFKSLGKDVRTAKYYIEMKENQLQQEISKNAAV